MNNYLHSYPLDFILYCTRIYLKTEGTGDLSRYCAAGTNWQTVIDVACRHGLNHFLYKALDMHGKDLVPASTLAQLKRIYFENSSRNILLSAGLLQTMDLFEHHGIPAIPFKGPVQAEILYQDIGVRSFSDLDIFVQEKDAVKARNLLLDRGFSGNVNISDTQIKSFLKKENFFQLINEAKTLNIDLHWELSGRYAKVPLFFSEFVKNLIEINLLGKKEVKTLNPEDMLIYLCIHGGSHCWGKLESIFSVAKIIVSGQVTCWEGVMAKANKYRCKHMLFIGLHLAQHFFDIDLPKQIQNEAIKNKISKPLNYIIQKIRTHKIAFSEGKNWRFSPLHFQIRDSFSDGVLYFFRLIFQPTIKEWQEYPLPDHFLFLYYFIRPCRLLIKGFLK